jgi:hypothetical protein
VEFVGWLPLFISSFLQDLYFCVYLGFVCFSRYVQENGVLFAITISGMAGAVGSSVSTFLYVDDIAIDRLSHWAQHSLLVCSKVDYGSFVYGSTMKSILSIIDRVHNMGILLATGTFHTSRPESLYAKSGEPPLSLQRNPMPLRCEAGNSATSSPQLVPYSIPPSAPGTN